MKNKLKWKRKWLDDNSGYWYSADVPVIGWEYIVNQNYLSKDSEEYIAGTYFSKIDDEITRFSNKFYKTENAAMKACEKHLISTAEKFNKWLNEQ